LNDNISVLILDDEQELGEEIAIWLQARNIRATHVATGEQFRKFLLSHSDVTHILSDIRLPFANGYDLVGRLREDHTLADQEVIYMSASPTTEDFNRMKETGSYHFISKPLDLEKLHAMLIAQSEPRSA
jgi:DNA-binding response OmpR family regulator